MPSSTTWIGVSIKAFLAFAFVALLAFSLGCVATNSSGNGQPDRAEFKIVESGAGGFSGAGFRFSVDSNGSYIYSSTEHHPAIINKTGAVSDASLGELKALMNKTDVFAFKDSYYVPPTASESYSGSVLFSINGKNKTVIFNDGSKFPPELAAILGKLAEMRKLSVG